MGVVKAVCISERKGIAKTNVGEARLLENFGMEGDAHAGKWHRQVSLLSFEKVEAFKQKGADVEPGAFGENLLVEGFDFKALPIGTVFQVNDVVLELTQVGKECHSHCAIYHQVGDCIMPREGVFTRVLKGGVVRVGDTMEIVSFGRPEHLNGYRVGILTASDKGSRGEREDKSGQVIKEIVEGNGYQVAAYAVLPDEREALADKMIQMCEENKVHLLLTTGGTGFSPRDCTPEATLDVVERLAPGIPEAIRAYSMQITKRSMLSRATAGIRKQTLIINLPGSPKAVRECLEYIIEDLEHGLGILLGEQGECARQ